MRILVTGRGTSGSWKIRGEQLGAAIGATVRPKASDHDLAVADLVVLVKRPDPDLLMKVQQARIPLVWDIVDAWPQPIGNTWDRFACLSWLESEMRRIKPVGVVTSPGAMFADVASFGIRAIEIPHHARPGLEANPIREELKRVGYEGGTQYLGDWTRRVMEWCVTNHADFLVNPARLSDLDVVLALRSPDGYAAKNWKSNVKLANAQGSGTPVICGDESSYRATSDGGVEFVTNGQELKFALDRLLPQAVRRSASERLLQQAIPLERVASIYRAWLEGFNVATRG